MFHRAKGRFLSTCAAFALLAGAPGAALAWAAGTHAYIAKQTTKKAGLTGANELCNRTFGANAVDMFNAVFTPEGQRLARAMHDRERLLPLEPWKAASGAVQVAFAYGMASHNDTWGTDSVAHYSGVTYGKEAGYVVAKAEILREQLRRYVPPGLPVSDDALLVVAHVLTEYAVDVQLAAVDPALGLELMGSAGCPDPVPAAFVVGALAPALAADAGSEMAAAAAIAGALQAFVPDLAATGYVLTLPRPVAIEAIASATAAKAEGFLGLPAGALEPIRSQLRDLCFAGIEGGILLTRDDFLGEIEATVGRTNGAMSSLGISP